MSEAGAGQEMPEPGANQEPDAFWSAAIDDPDTVTAMVVSDLHYTEYKGVDNTVVPGMALAEEITDAILAEVIDRRPDVLILTGDNTNSGDRKDAEGLVRKLRRVRDAGIRIIITTGNHDMNRMDGEDFEEVYFGLVEIADPETDRDKASLSYVAEVGEAVFVAMDDNAVHPGGQGEFSAETMEWLRRTLERYNGHPIIWLSHHNVLYGRGADYSASNLIQNPDLPDVLRDGGVKVALTGHLHFQYILGEKNLFEIISAMPFSGQHLMGRLAVGPGGMRYRAEAIDFGTYAPDVGAALAEMDGGGSRFLRQTFEQILKKEGVNAYETRRILDLLDRYFVYYADGSLGDHVSELRNDPAYRRALEILDGYNYGPWIRSMVETTRMSGVELEVEW